VGNGNHPVGLPIVLQFNRLLNPGSVTRQSIQLLTSSHTTFSNPSIAYDPVLMTVTLSNPMDGTPWLVANQIYEIDFPVPQNKNDINGLQAIDNATFASPASVAFTVVAGGTAPEAPTVNFCADILFPFLSTQCGTCHATPSGLTQPAAGLVLDSSEGVALTAIGHVAHGSNTGASAGVTESPGTIFGVDMPIIDPGTDGTGDPANSWLLYKLLLADPGPVGDGAPSYLCGAAQTNVSYDRSSVEPQAMSTERTILSNFILGRQMPYTIPPSLGPQPGLSVQDLERLRLWIAQGAQVEDCTQCVQVVDGGTDGATDAPEDGPADAGTDGPLDAGTQG
jgi:hypothetical protein